jgi:alpha-glucosidase
MAHPGWVGSGITPDPWWKHAVFYQIAPPNTSSESADISGQTSALKQDQYFSDISSQLDSLHTLGVDALLLPMPRMPDASSPDANLDDFDELLHQASRRDIRVLITFPASDLTADLPAIARFWLSRGVAGFRLVTPPGTNPQFAEVIEQTLHKITASAVGARIVLSDFNPDAPTSLPASTPVSEPERSTSTPQPPAHPSSRRHASRRSANRAVPDLGAQLQIDPRLSQLGLPEAAKLRPLLTQSILKQNILLDFYSQHRDQNSSASYPALAQTMAAVLLTTHSAALIDPELADKSLADWTGKLSALHHGNPSLRNGTVTMLDFDRQNALVWVSRPASPSGNTPPVVVACNLSSLPLRLSLGTAVHGLNLRGSYLRTLLRSDTAMGAQDLDSVTLPPFGVYIGELHR